MASTLQVCEGDDSHLNVIANRSARFSVQSQPIQILIDPEEHGAAIRNQSEFDNKSSSLNCLTTIQVVIMVLIIAMFALDIYTFYFSLYVISKDEVTIHRLQMIKFSFETKMYSEMSDAEQKELMKLNEEFPSMFDTIHSNQSLPPNSHSKLIELINLRELNTKIDQMTDQKSNLISMIMITLAGLVMHLVGLVGAIRHSFTLTLLETLNVVIQVALKHPTSYDQGNFYLIWPIYSACLPAFIFCQIKLYYVKIKQ